MQLHILGKPHELAPDLSGRARPVHTGLIRARLKTGLRLCIGRRRPVCAKQSTGSMTSSPHKRANSSSTFSQFAKIGVLKLNLLGRVWLSLIARLAMRPWLKSQVV